MSRTLIGGITNRVLMLIAAGLLVLSYASAFVNPAKAWYMMLPGLLFFPIALLNLFLLVWAFVRRSRAFIIPLAALLPTLFFLGRYVQSGKSEIEAGEESLRIVSYNVGRFANLRDEGGRPLRGACKSQIYRTLDSLDADIVCLQEYYAESQEELESQLRRGFRGYDFDYYIYTGKYGCFGNVTLSRFPIKGQGVIKFDQSSNLALYTDIEAHGRKFRLYNCHFESYNISFPGMVKGLIDRKDGVLKEAERKVRHSLSLRPKQVEQVIGHISDCPLETVLCGDFNDNPMSYTYQRLIRGHRDTFCEAGRGFGATYATLWPLLRIDYVFIPKEFRALSHGSPRSGLSDHFPVVCEVGL